MTDGVVANWLDDSEAQQAWDLVVEADPVKRTKALSYWARHRDMLPGPIFMQLAPSELLSGSWQRIVHASESWCDCGQRRMLLPAASTHLYMPLSAQRHTLSKGLPQVFLAPWGGDFQSVDLALSTANSQLVMEIMPFAGLTPDQLAARGGGAIKHAIVVDGDVLGATRPLSQVRVDLENIAAMIEERGGPVPIPTIIRKRGAGEESASDIAHYPFAVTGVHVATSTAIIAVNRNTRVIDQNSRVRFHTCA